MGFHFTSQHQYLDRLQSLYLPLLHAIYTKHLVLVISRDHNSLTEVLHSNTAYCPASLHFHQNKMRFTIVIIALAACSSALAAPSTNDANSQNVDQAANAGQAKASANAGQAQATAQAASAANKKNTFIGVGVGGGWGGWGGWGYGYPGYYGWGGPGYGGWY